MAVKPWLGAMIAPTDYKEGKMETKPPKAALELDYVHGYRAKDMRNNVRYLKDGSIVYNAAALGIVLDQNSNT